MTPVQQPLLLGLGVTSGGLIALQSVLNASLGQRIGNLGAVFVLTVISAVFLVGVLIFFPSTSDLEELPASSEWYLYLGGILGVAILAAPVFLVPELEPLQP